MSDPTINHLSSHSQPRLEHRKGVFSRLGPNPPSAICMSDPAISHQSRHSRPPLKHRKGVFARLGPNPQSPVCMSDCTTNHLSSQCALPVQICALASEYIVSDPVPTTVGDIMEVDPTTLELHTTMSPDETPSMPCWNCKRRRGNEKSNAQVAEGRKKRRLIRPSLEVDPTTSELHTTMSSDETPSMPFSNYKRRRGDDRDDKSETELAGGKKKRLIRPSLELEDKDSGLLALKSPIGIYRDESEVKDEVEGKRQKKDFVVSGGPLLKTETSLDRLQERTNNESEGVLEADIVGTSHLVSDRMNITGLLFSEGQTELLVLERNEQETQLPNAIPINSEPGNEIVDTSVLEPELDNSKVNLCSHNAERNLVESESGNLERSALSPEAMLPKGA